jgi:electron transport complex protein RnfG
MSERIEVITIEGEAQATPVEEIKPPQDSGPSDQGPSASPFLLVATLTIVGILAGLLIVMVYQATLPSILEYRAQQVELAVKEVLDEPARVSKRYFYKDELIAELPADAPTGIAAMKIEKIFLGYREDGSLKGVAITHAEPGFQDLVNVIFGYSPDQRQVLGMKVLGHKETPGLGDKIIKDLAFVEQFFPVATPIVGVKMGRNDGSPQNVDMITGATISSKVVIRIINHAIERWDPVLSRSNLQEVRSNLPVASSNPQEGAEQ